MWPVDRLGASHRAAVETLRAFGFFPTRMRYATSLILATVLVAMMCAPAHAQQTPDSTRVAGVIRQLEHEWADALIRQDSTRLHRLLAPEFALVASANAEQPMFRRDWFALLPRYRTHELSISKLTVRVLGDIAIASFVTDLRATVAGVDRSNRLFVTDVWRNGPSGWLAVARYSSTPEPARAGTTELRSKP
jgi:ketosteroid isomerase-like protein